MRTVGVGAARTQFYRILDGVARGEEVVLTRRGVPVARLVPLSSADADANDLDRRIREFRKGHSLRGVSIRELIDEGR